MRVVVLAIDDDQVLGPAGDDELPVPQQSEVAGVEPAVGRAQLGGAFGILVIALRHVVAADVHMAQHAFTQHRAGPVRDAELDAG